MNWLLRWEKTVSIRFLKRLQSHEDCLQFFWFSRYGTSSLPWVVSKRSCWISHSSPLIPRHKTIVIIPPYIVRIMYDYNWLMLFNSKGPSIDQWPTDNIRRRANVSIACAWNDSRCFCASWWYLCWCWAILRSLHGVSPLNWDDRPLGRPVAVHWRHQATLRRFQLRAVRPGMILEPPPPLSRSSYSAAARPDGEADWDRNCGPRCRGTPWPSVPKQTPGDAPTMRRKHLERYRLRSVIAAVDLWLCRLRSSAYSACTFRIGHEKQLHRRMRRDVCYARTAVPNRRRVQPKIDAIAVTLCKCIKNTWNLRNKRIKREKIRRFNRKGFRKQR